MKNSEPEKKKLKEKNIKKIERFKATMQKKKNIRFSKVLKEESQKIGLLSSRDIYLAGIFLYWAEGTKAWDSKTEFTNSDPILIKLFVTWLLQEGISLEKIKIRLQLYSDMSIEETISFWSEFLKMPKSQFSKPMIKKSKKSRISYKGRHGHGTCQVIYGDRLLNERIRAGIGYLRFLFS